ncbi:DUF6577 family protein [Chondrinema litorale]|uniref:DUF6577 family protein n=1 Tax=Chondrinema litorale TaxID=2994555 RepID=UPI002543A401|nr:DUF6577 family protein [Chondrinema litorale]UZS00098.1 hypothetical protein OQ292_39855 [Chondrinema litorale]
MKKSELASKLKEYFANQSIITTKEITKVLANAFPEVSTNTISWRINQLKKEKLIYQTGRGLYSFEFKPEYTPDFSLKTKRLYNRMKPFCKAELSMWDTQMLNHISETNVDRYWVFLSTKKEELEPLFENMLDFSKQTFLQPDKEVISRYLMAHTEAVIITPLVSETPLCKLGEYITPTIEGLLVNVWLKYENYLKPIGFDIKKLYEQAFKKYSINQSKLLRYAARRDKRNEINEFIKSIE